MENNLGKKSEFGLSLPVIFVGLQVLILCLVYLCQYFHPLTDIQLQSAYQSVMGSEPPYTNYTGNFKGVLDYVWFSNPHIRPLAVAPVPTEEDILKVCIIFILLWIDQASMFSFVLLSAGHGSVDRAPAYQAAVVLPEKYFPIAPQARFAVYLL